MKLEARDISFRYGEGERQVLAHVDLTVESGERVGIMAPSGFGKTTLPDMKGRKAGRCCWTGLLWSASGDMFRSR